MTFVTAVAWSAMRAVVVTAAVLAVSHRWSGWLDAAPSSRRGIYWSFVLLPGLVPELLLGYAYTPMVAGRPRLAELVCAALLMLRLLPVGVIAWQLSPPSPISPSAWHLRTLLPRRTWSDWWHFCRVGPVRRAVPPAVMVGVLAFQEFELAALLRATSWTDTLFVDQVGGRAFGDLVRSALGPAMLQVMVMLAALRCLSGDSSIGVPRLSEPCASPSHAHRHGSQTRGTLGLWRHRLTHPAPWGLVAWTALIIIPLWSLAAGLPAGFRQLASQSLRWQGLLRELAGGLAVSVFAACAAWILAGSWRFLPPIDRRWRQGVAVLACLPGLSGALVLSLGMLTVFQRSWLSGMYDTPLLWVLASILFLLPRAVLLRMWLLSNDNTAVAVARRLAMSQSAHQRRSGRALLWQLETEPRFLAVCCLAYWSYLELTLAALLAPTGLPSGLVRLYNFLHFGRTAALSAEMAILLGGPLLLATIVWGLARRGRV